METYLPDKTFDFKTISLADPQPVQGGTYFTKLSVDSKPCYIQLPKCTMKQGIVETKRGKYCDLLYTSSAETELLHWMSLLEDRCQQLIFDKKDIWFHNELTKDDIESMLTSLFRLYRGGQQVLLRTHIEMNKQTGSDKCIAYNEKHVKQDLKDVNINNYIIPLICIEGIKFSSKSFEFDIKLMQIMVLEPEPEPMDVCLIKHATHVNKSTPLGNLIKNNIQSKSDDENNLEQSQHISKSSHEVAMDISNADVDVDVDVTKILASGTPASGTPASNTPASNTPASNTLASDTSVSDTPASGTPVSDTLASGTPVSGTPVSDTLASGTPVSDTPVSDTLASDTSVSGTPVSDTGVSDTPVSDTPVSDTPVSYTHASDTPVSDTLASDTSVSDTPVSDTPVSDTPVSEATDSSKNVFKNPSLDGEISKDSTYLNTVEEVHPKISDESDSVKLKDPDEVYYEIYRAARDKAKHMRRIAIEAFLEAKDIKTKYLLDDIEDSDEEEEI